MKEKRKAILVSILGTLGLILIMVGATYAWFSTQIDGNGPEINVTTATMGPLTYTGSEITATGVLPGWESEDTDLTIEGTVTGNDAVEYYCTIKNTGGVTDVEYRISSDGEADSSNGTWTSITDEPIIIGSISNTNLSDTYKIKVRFKETGEDQNTQQGETLSVRVICEVGESGTKFYEQILADNPVVSTRTTFNAAFTTSNSSDEGNIIYKEDFIQDEQNYTTYYFAGQVLNNYVKFGTDSSGNDLYWRIVRINEDNSVRLLYAGTSITDAAAFITTSQRFNEITHRNSAYVGYMYQISGIEANDGSSPTGTIQHGYSTSSTVKIQLDTWYTNNLEDAEDGYISKTAIYCNDRTVTNVTWSTGNLTYDVATRLFTNKTPTYICDEPLDRFTVSEKVGNGRLIKPIGLLTADEVSYAGGVNGAINKAYYISENAKNGTNSWWTMSPSGSSSNGADVFSVGTLSGDGLLSSNFTDNLRGVRPVISLKSCVKWKGGDGTSGNPYTVSVSDSCALLEN